MRHVIHAVGPVWHGGSSGEPEALASCYRRAIELADEAGDTRVAFPAISTGVYSYPLEAAAAVAVRATRDALDAHPGVEEARFWLFADGAYARSRPRFERRGERPADAGGDAASRSASRTPGRRRCTWWRRWTACPRCAAC